MNDRSSTCDEASAGMDTVKAAAKRKVIVFISARGESGPSPVTGG
jgi:Flp pilus assembly CpaE family ATPase